MVTLMCLLRLDDWLKLFPQTIHLWGLCFSCTCKIWILNRSFFSKDLEKIIMKFSQYENCCCFFQIVEFCHYCYIIWIAILSRSWIVLFCPPLKKMKYINQFKCICKLYIKNLLSNLSSLKNFFLRILVLFVIMF